MQKKLRLLLIFPLLSLLLQACAFTASTVQAPTAALPSPTQPAPAQPPAKASPTQAKPPKATPLPPSAPQPTQAVATSLAQPVSQTSKRFPGLQLIPAGEFEMGDHHNFVDPAHPSDETPIHTVHIDSFYLSATEATNQQYVEFLNAALAQNTIEVHSGTVYGKGGNEIYFTTRQADEFSRIGWDGRSFSVLDNRGSHPVTSVRWWGAAAYTNWLSLKNGLEACYNLSSGACDFTKKGFRLPSEAEWEYAARGGRTSPYTIFPWGDNADITLANWPNSGDPFETGPLPWTTPVGFYNGELRRKADFGWPGSQEVYQTGNSVNGFGLYDVAGNTWEYVSDWYGRDYYSTSPRDNPRGPNSASPMPDGKLYHGMRGGSWYNGENGHSRVANRNPSYFRGPQDPNHPYYHLSFRVALDLHGEIQ